MLGTKAILMSKIDMILANIKLKIPPIFKYVTSKTLFSLRNLQNIFPFTGTESLNKFTLNLPDTLPTPSKFLGYS